MRKKRFGDCDCGGDLIPVWFKDEERRTAGGIMVKTGRTRNAVSHLTCESCLKNECVDDSFDGEWR
jgi:hypothetical protein